MNEKLELSLTPKQEKFVQGLFIGLSQREAYKQAYSAENMQDKAIDVNSCKLLKQTNISLRLQELQKTLENRNLELKEKIINQLARIALADIKDYVEFKTEVTMIDTQEGKFPSYTHTINIKDSKEVDGTLISEVSLDAKGTLKFKMHDKLSAVEKLAKILGITQEEKTAGGGDTVNYIFQLQPPTEKPQEEIIDVTEPEEEND